MKDRTRAGESRVIGVAAIDKIPAVAHVGRQHEREARASRCGGAVVRDADDEVGDPIVVDVPGLDDSAHVAEITRIN